MPKKILFCVLNWGLGHASRSVPVIQNLINQGNHLTLASDGNALSLLRKEFPLLHSVELPAYDITYKYESIALNMAMQARKFLKAIKKENAFVEVLVAEHHIEQIVSDNRFGCYHNKVPSVFMTHQIRLMHSKKLLQATGTAFNTGLIEKFDICWVPDYANVENLSGEMSRNVELRIPIDYISPQSRFDKIPLKDNPKFKSLSILSGPEPQRTVLEEKIIVQLKQLEGQHAIVSGVNNPVVIEENISIFGLLDQKQLSELIAESVFLISRSGYSSIMDYEAMGRKAILIPTPGQTEQIYLAKRALEFERHFVLDQADFQLAELID